MAFLGRAGGFPYNYTSPKESFSVITKFTCGSNYDCPVVEIEDQSSCDKFGGNAVVTCVTSKGFDCFSLLELTRNVAFLLTTMYSVL